jgi:hypothetical protein
LIGDPLLKLHHPQQVDVQVARYAAPGERIDVDVTSPIAGKCYVELVCRRDRTTFRPPSRPSFEATETVLASYTEVYRKANDHRYAARAFTIEPGTFRTRIDVPEDSLGPCHVRVFVQGTDDHALGAHDIYVRQRPPATAGKQNSG